MDKNKTSSLPPKPQRDSVWGPGGLIIGLPERVLNQIAELKRLDQEKDHGHRLFYLFLILIILGSWGIHHLLNSSRTKTTEFNFSTDLAVNSAPVSGIKTSVSRPAPAKPNASRLSGFPKDPLNRFLPALTAQHFKQIDGIMGYVYQNIHPQTHLAYSLPGDSRLLHWSVAYDNAIRSMFHLITGDEAEARAVIDYFIENKAIQLTGYVIRDGRKVNQPGWIINIVDAAQSRWGGRGIEFVAHAGPNIFLGVAAAHLYHQTREEKYLEFARERWNLIEGLQNLDPQSPNYGGIRMGPLGTHNNPLEQKAGFVLENPSWYHFYNGEHAADFKGFCSVMLQVDPENHRLYQRASDLITRWDKKIYDPQNHLFFMGTTEKRYFDVNIGEYVDPGLMPLHPLDTSAIKLSVYGVDGMEKFGPGAAQKVRQAIEDQFKVRVVKKEPRKKDLVLEGYDFVSHNDRKRIILYEEEGPLKDTKVNRGVGRKALLSDEWSTWVAMADLRLARDYLKKGQTGKARKYIAKYKENAIHNGMASAYQLGSVLAYPYAHPLPYSLNKPVGFGWNTHHEPYALIGGMARVMGFLRFDPFHLTPHTLDLDLTPEEPKLADMPETLLGGLVTEAEVYLEEAWKWVRAAQSDKINPEDEWRHAIFIVDRMMKEHPDWIYNARRQNQLAMNAENPFPLKEKEDVTIPDLEPLFRDYWALYHVGTAEFIRFMGYSKLADSALKADDLDLYRSFRKEALGSAELLVSEYFYSQAYDERGWMWQPVNSMAEFLGLTSYHPVDLLTPAFGQSEAEQARLISDIEISFPVR